MKKKMPEENEPEHYRVHVTENDFDCHYSQYITEGFTTYEQAFAYAKEHSKNEAYGRHVNYSAIIYKVTRCVSVYQHVKTNEYIITEEENF